MENNLCVSCNKYPIFIKKRGLCRNCYQRLRNKYRGKSLFELDHEFAEKTLERRQHKAEIEFIGNFFTHRKWLHHPTLFYLNDIKYTPDFYDAKRNVFIEVSGTRQAYHANKDKYDLFRKLFPQLNFEIRKPSGELLNEGIHYKEWEQ